MCRSSFDENAEARCEECLRNAVTECESNAEARHLFASFWLSKDDKEVGNMQVTPKHGIFLA